MRSKLVFALLAGCAVIAVVALSGAPTFGQNVRTVRMSVSPGGADANGPSLLPSVSADGRYVAFASDAFSLVPKDTSNRDVFVRDRLALGVELVSQASDGTPGNGPSLFPALSGDGRYAVFQSDASNLAGGDTNHATDVFVHDRATGITARASVAGDGAEGDGGSTTPSISADGRYVAFTSFASNLVADDTNSDGDVFVRDLVAGTTELASVASDGTHGNTISGGLGAGPARISGDGRYVVFGSFASNLVANDTNNVDDIFLRDRIAGTTERMSVASDETEGNAHHMYGSVSDDGRFVAFHSSASNLVGGDSNGASDVFLRDRTTGVTTRLSVGPGDAQADGPSRFAVVSADGGTIAYQSDATNLVSGDTNGATDVFSYHMAGEFTDRTSVPAAGGEAHGVSTFAAINGDGSVVAFQSGAPDLVADDSNGVADIFVRGKAPEPAATPTPRPPTVTPTPTSAPRIGDVNGDRQVNTIDAAIILQYAAGFLPSPPGGALSDVNHDGQTNAIDVALILQFSAGLLGQWPP